jgi:hypothetical protein
MNLISALYWLKSLFVTITYMGKIPAGGSLQYLLFGHYPNIILLGFLWNGIHTVRIDMDENSIRGYH